MQILDDEQKELIGWFSKEMRTSLDDGGVHRIVWILSWFDYKQENGLNPGVTYLDWKRTSGWLESREGLLFATDVLTTCVEAIFRVKTWLWRWLPHFLSKHQSQTTVLLMTPIIQMIFFNQDLTIFGYFYCICHHQVPFLLLNHPIVVKVEQNQDYFMHLFTNLLQPQVTQ